MSRTDDRRLIARWDAGAPLNSFDSHERASLRRLIIAAPGYLNAKHEHHAMLVDAARELYAMDVPQAEDDQ